MINKTTKLFEKKLGAYYMIDWIQDNETGIVTITLYKKWSKASGYETTDYIIRFEGNERERALSVFNGITLKNMYDEFEKWKRIKGE